MIRQRKPLKRTPLPRRKKPLKRSYIKRKPPKKRKPMDKASQERRRENPYSSYWFNACDVLWSWIVRSRNAGKSEKSQRYKGLADLDAHHIVRRGYLDLRHDLKNGIALSAWEHITGPKAPHSSAKGKKAFDAWLKENKPETWKYTRAKLREIKRRRGVIKIDYKERYYEMLRLSHEMGLKVPKSYRVAA